VLRFWFACTPRAALGNARTGCVLRFWFACTPRAALENARTGCVLRFWFATPGMRWDDGNRSMPVRYLGATWRTSVDPRPRLPQPPEGGGDPCQSDLGPKAPQGNLQPVNLRGEGTPAKATWHPERSRESRAAAQGWGTPQAFRAPAWPLPPSRKPGRSVGGSNQLWHFDPVLTSTFLTLPMSEGPSGPPGTSAQGPFWPPRTP
jgi:hypothetical protein